METAVDPGRFAGASMPELLSLWEWLTPDEQSLLWRVLNPSTPWIPQPGPQTVACLSPAKEIFFGGQAGGGKTDLLLGLAGNEHRRGVILRKNYTLIDELVARSREMFEGIGNLNMSKPPIWRFNDYRSLQFGAVADEKNLEGWRGRPKDYHGFDEVTELQLITYETITRWNRTVIPDQRTRVVSTLNPPQSETGRWVVSYLAPWLDRRHPNPAVSGEVRWFVRLSDGDYHEVPDGTPVLDPTDGETYYPRSRTFIRARLADNVYLSHDTDYLSTLQATPEPLRSMLLRGDFDLVTEDNPMQLIPTDWVERSFERWQDITVRSNGDPRDVDGFDALDPLVAVGVDVARGGRDRTVITLLYGSYVKQVEIPGSQTRDGEAVVKKIVELVTPHDPRIGIDVIGPGASVLDEARKPRWKLRPYAVTGSSKSKGRVRGTKLRFVNLRSEMYWRIREALNPESDHPLALPPDRELLQELCILTWDEAGGMIRVEGKDDVVRRLGRSPDKADSLAYGHRMTYLAVGIS